MFFIGRTRFSLFVPNSKSWRLSQTEEDTPIDSYRERLYEDRRLRVREQIFLNHTLPSLAMAAEGFDVTHVVSYSRSLPEKYKQSLVDAAARFSFLVLDEQLDGKTGRSLHALAKERAQLGETFGIYRLDDDDVLPVNFFERMGNYINPNFSGMVVSFPLGIEALLEGGSVYNLKTAHFPMNSMGLMYVCQISTDGRLIAPNGGPHNKADRVNAVVIDSRDFGYFRFNHSGQDNSLRSGSQSPLATVKKAMSKYPDFHEHERLHELFPTIVGILGTEEELILLSRPRTVSLPLRVELSKPASKGTIEFECLFPVGTTERSALVTFEFVNARGRRLDSNVKVPGVPISARRTIGHYKYLNSEEGKISTKLDFELPEGCFLKSIRLKRFGLKSKPFVVNSISMRIPHTNLDAY